MGGTDQQKRMNIDKLKSLRKALQYSYQAATAVLLDGREFRCLINPNKLSVDLDNKILSIPFEACPVNGEIKDEPNIDNSDLGFETGIDVEGIWNEMVPVDCVPDAKPYPKVPSSVMQVVGLKEGDVIEWKENGSYWLIYLQKLEETAYFRADLRRCRYQVELENGSKYWVYVKGPSEKNINWKQGGGVYYNTLNYTVQLYITQNEETLDYFHRFKKIFLHGRPWEVQAIDDISTPGLIEVHLKETYNNIHETDIEAAVDASINVDIIDEKDEMYIHGQTEVYPYEAHKYELKNYVGATGTWHLENMSRKGMAKLVDPDKKTVTVNILTGKSGNFELLYKTPQGAVVAVSKINVKSL